MNEFLDFTEKKVQQLSMEQLRISNIPKIGGGEFQNGIRHYDLFDSITNIFENEGYRPEMDKMYAASSREAIPGVETSEELESQFGKGNIKTFTFRKLLTKINLPVLSDSEKIESLAVSYHQSGIQVAYGPNIRICSNMTILGSSYSFQLGLRDSKNDINRLFNVIRGWMNVAESRWLWENKIIELMKSREVTIEQFQQFVGLITLMRLSKEKSYVLPLNQGQLNVVAQKYVDELDSRKEKGMQGSTMSLWEIYNMGTSVHKPEDMQSIQDIIPSNTSFGNVVSEFFGVPLDFNPNLYTVRKSIFPASVVVEDAIFVENNDDIMPEDD